MSPIASEVSCSWNLKHQAVAGNFPLNLLSFVDFGEDFERTPDLPFSGPIYQEM